MKQILKKSFLAFCFWQVMVSGLEADSLENERKAHMIADLKTIKHTFEIGYAPADWKKEYANWDLNQEFEKAKQLVLDTSPLSAKDFQVIVRDFLASMHDYHVDVLFYSTESAMLPFTVKGANGRYFIDWIDKAKLNPKFYTIQAGDELLEFDGRPIADVIADLKAHGNKKSNALTDQAFAEMTLTNRQGFVGDRVPKGSTYITIRSLATGNLHTYQLMWKYNPEIIKSPFDFIPSSHFAMPNIKSIKMPKLEMMSPLHREYVKRGGSERDGDLGGRKSFIPPLGPVLWSYEESKKNEKQEGGEEDSDFSNVETISWHAYIYENAQKQRIGYIRIPHYLGEEEDFEQFGKIMEFFQEHTEALVIDQVYNIGGYVSFLYDLASTLSPTPLKTSKHRLKITQSDVLSAYVYLGIIDSYVSALEMDTMGLEGTEIDYQKLLFFKEFFQFTIDEWSIGRLFTNPIHLEGVDWINPHPRYQYTKPILMLINEMDFSGGDFMPAILQDNKRATLFGTRTAGAGGYVLQSHFINDNGIATFSYTGSLAERVNAQKIENLGVSPDIEYRLTEEDLQYGYQRYVSAVNEAIQSLLQQANP
ncbi:protease-like activity factor CPAF [Candidatus Protochlamydia phocaeensis]|uniref:protease-like activity factor CPAF n=1 Tax=Candidatus Protochlamydia phocaeensis TaxID=1414722 RepID=UPI000838AE1A|nr:protease-like activity factor CPAF [Candidatus Protochlamydia phocaeensis]